MTTLTDKSRLLDVVGSTDLAIVEYPYLIGTTKKSPPDGTSAVPYFSNLSGTVLLVAYTVPGVSGPEFCSTPVNVEFVTNSLQDALVALNAADPTNLEFSDANGYLKIRNKNGGSGHMVMVLDEYTHFVGFDSTVYTCTAATVLGLHTFHAGFTTGDEGYIRFDLTNGDPKAFCVAGSLDYVSPGYNKPNYSTTHLLKEDEDLTSAAINRAIYGVAVALEKVISEVDIQEPVVDTWLFNSAQVLPAANGTIYIRVSSQLPGPLPNWFSSNTNPPADLSDYFTILDSNGSPIYNSDGTRVKVIKAAYINPANWDGTINDSSYITSLPPSVTGPGGVTACPVGTFGVGFNQTKKFESTITSIDGSLITFFDNPWDVNSYPVEIGDTLVINPSQNSPDGSGEYVITGRGPTAQSVYVRPKTDKDWKYDYDSQGQATSVQGYKTQARGLLSGSVGATAFIPVGQWAPVLSTAQVYTVLTLNATDAAFSTSNNQLRYVTRRLKEAKTGKSYLSDRLVDSLMAKLVRTANPSGADVIGAKAVGTDLVAGTIAAQIASLATEWLKLDRQNTVTAVQTLNGTSSSSDVLATTNIASTSNYRCLWKITVATDLYAGLWVSNTGFAIAYNAQWNSTSHQWESYDPSAMGLRLELIGNSLYQNDFGFSVYLQMANGPWTRYFHTGVFNRSVSYPLTQIATKLLYDWLPTAGQENTVGPNTLLATSYAKSQGFIHAVGSGGTSATLTGFNTGFSAVNYSTTSIVVTFRNAMADTNYTINAQVNDWSGNATCMLLTRISSKTTSGFTIEFRKSTDGTVVDVRTNAQTIDLSVLVFGKELVV